MFVFNIPKPETRDQMFRDTKSNFRNPNYFRNLDGFRGFAAVFVIIGHCQSWIFEHSEKNLHVYVPWGYKLASFGVDFFFVLSGFLISTVLYKELEQNNTINIGRFYTRRILRLWPLYFFYGITVIVFGTLIAHSIGFNIEAQSPKILFENLAYLITFTTNFQTLNHDANQYSSFFLGHYWSLSVEEQFYLIFAPLLLFCKNRVQLLLSCFILLGLLLTVFRFDFYSKYSSFTYNFTLNRFFHFGLGALLAYWIHKKKLQPLNELSIYENYILQLSFLTPCLIFIFGKYYSFSPDLDGIAHGLLSAGLILTGISRFSILPFEWSPLKYIGKISFGIYIFHLLCMHITSYLLQSANLAIENSLFILSFPIITFILSVILASLSYRFLEKPFLNRKEKLKQI